MRGVNGWKIWIFEDVIEGPRFGTPKFRDIKTFCYIYLFWKLHESSLSG